MDPTSRWLGSHENQHHQLFVRVVDHTVILTGGSQSDFISPEFTHFRADRHLSFALEDIVYLVRAIMRMNLLRLTRFKTIYVTKKLIRIENTDLVQLVALERDQITHIRNLHIISYEKTEKEPGKPH